MKFIKDNRGLLGLEHLPCGQISFDDEATNRREEPTFVSNLTRAARVIARAVTDGRLLNKNGCVSDFLNQLTRAGLPENINLIMEAIAIAPCVSIRELAAADIAIEKMAHWGIASPLPHLYLRHPRVTGVDLWHVEQAVEILHLNAVHGYGLTFLQAIRIVLRLIALEAPKDNEDFERRVRQMPEMEIRQWEHEVSQRVAGANFLIKRVLRLRPPGQRQ